MICSFVRLLSRSAASAGPGAPRWIARHVSRCPACRRNTAEIEHLERLLLHPPEREDRGVPAGLVERTLARVDGVLQGNAARQPRPVPRFAWAMAAVALALAAGVGLDAWNRAHRPADFPATTAASTAPDVWLPRPDPEALLTLGEALDAPLREELAHLVADAQGAARSLAAAFLPPDPRL